MDVFLRILGILVLGLVLIAVVLLPLGLVLWVFTNVARMRRPKLLTRAALRASLCCVDKASPFSSKPLPPLSWPGGVKNVIKASWKNGDFWIFDYEPRQDEQLLQKRTIAGFPHNKPMPAFNLQPVTVFNRFRFFTWASLQAAFNLLPRGGLPGWRQISFISDREFSRFFLLGAYDETLVRNVFTPEIRAFLEQLGEKNKWCVWSNGGWLLVYCQNPQFGFEWKWMGIKLEEGWLVSPSDLRAFADHASAIAAKFLEKAPNGEEQTV